jgi:DUF1707 SHOCT-like domain
VVAGPGDEMAVGAAGRGRMRASLADREQVIEALKDAFAHSQLTRDEFDTRSGHALTAETRADLAALTTYVTYRIEPHAGGTRFTYEHTGFTGVGGFLLAKLLASVRKKMLTAGLPAVLDDLDDNGALRSASV